MVMEAAEPPKPSKKKSKEYRNASRATLVLHEAEFADQGLMVRCLKCVVFVFFFVFLQRATTDHPAG
jgi:hypothetical protein